MNRFGTVRRVRMALGSNSGNSPRSKHRASPCSEPLALETGIRRHEKHRSNIATCPWWFPSFCGNPFGGLEVEVGFQGKSAKQIGVEKARAMLQMVAKRRSFQESCSRYILQAALSGKRLGRGKACKGPANRRLTVATHSRKRELA